MKLFVWIYKNRIKCLLRMRNNIILTLCIPACFLFLSHNFFLGISREEQQVSIEKMKSEFVTIIHYEKEEKETIIYYTFFFLILSFFSGWFAGKLEQEQLSYHSYQGSIRLFFAPISKRMIWVSYILAALTIAAGKLFLLFALFYQLCSPSFYINWITFLISCFTILIIGLITGLVNYQKIIKKG